MRRLAVFLLLLACSFAAFANTPFAQRVGLVVLDAGHGGNDPGALASWSFAQSMEEKSFTLDIAKRVRGILAVEAPSLEVVLTRSDDTFVSLQDRSAIAVAAEPPVGTSAIFVSIHANSAAASSASGYELLIKPMANKVGILGADSPLSAAARFSQFSNTALNRQLNQGNALLATTLEDSLERAFPSARNRGVKETEIYVLNNSRMPSVLIEVGFLSNEADARNLSLPSWRQEMARAIATGILKLANPS